MADKAIYLGLEANVLAPKHSLRGAVAHDLLPWVSLWTFPNLHTDEGFRPFLHILDEFALEMILLEFDTARDFLTHLAARERFLANAGYLVIAPDGAEACRRVADRATPQIRQVCQNLFCALQYNTL